MKKILSPKEVLLAVAAYYASTENYDIDAKLSVRFIDDAGSIELHLITPKDSVNLN